MGKNKNLGPLTVGDSGDGAVPCDGGGPQGNCRPVVTGAARRRRALRTLAPELSGLQGWGERRPRPRLGDGRGCGGGCPPGDGEKGKAANCHPLRVQQAEGLDLFGWWQA